MNGDMEKQMCEWRESGMQSEVCGVGKQNHSQV